MTSNRYSYSYRYSYTDIQLCSYTGLQGRGGASGAMVATNGGQEAAECYVKIYFGDGNEAVLDTGRHGRGREDR